MSLARFDTRDDRDTLPMMTEQDTQECAAFLLALKHRSVTPEPYDDDDMSTPRLEAASHEPAVFEPFYLNEDSDNDSSSKVPPSLSDEHDEIDVESFVDEGALVTMKDRDLVPDSLFVAMAQMKPCALTEPDRVGCYKNREIGFIGMCCKHCGGQPGFGKYFPATVRSLAQTTTSQTILKHVGSKCRFCPPEVREAVLELQRKQAIKDASNVGRPRYGSRKVFFQRIWGRLHDVPMPERPLYTKIDGCDESLGMSHVRSESEEDINNLSESNRKRKHRFGVLPTNKNISKKIKRSRDILLED